MQPPLFLGGCPRIACGEQLAAFGNFPARRAWQVAPDPPVIQPSDLSYFTFRDGHSLAAPDPAKPQSLSLAVSATSSMFGERPR